MLGDKFVIYALKMVTNPVGRDFVKIFMWQGAEWQILN
jgi:hypothetical protein